MLRSCQGSCRLPLLPNGLWTSFYSRYPFIGCNFHVDSDEEAMDRSYGAISKAQQPPCHHIESNPINRQPTVVPACFRDDRTLRQSLYLVPRQAVLPTLPMESVLRRSVPLWPPQALKTTRCTPSVPKRSMIGTKTALTKVGLLR